MIRWNAFAFLCVLITISFVKTLPQAETASYDLNDEKFSALLEKLIYIQNKVNSTNENVGAIQEKLIEIEQKDNAMEHRLLDMTNTETINVESIITQTVKEHEMQRSLDKIAQKVEDVSVVQREMKTDFQILNKNFGEKIKSHREIPEMQLKNSEMNFSLIESLIGSFKNQTTIEIASLGKAVMTIANVVRELRDSHHKLGLLLESFISNENKKVIDNIESNSNEIKNLLEIAQKDMRFSKHDSIDDNHDQTNNLVLPKRELHYIQSMPDFFKGNIFESCTAALKSSGMSGVYKLFIPESGFGTFEAYCLLHHENGNGWTLIQHRKNNETNFLRDWLEYKKGFGNPHASYWIGLEKIHAITSRKRHELWIGIEIHGKIRKYAKYSHFEIGSERERYYLKSVSNYSGDAADFLGEANKLRKFSTFDVDNDIDSKRNCVNEISGAWWYDTCDWSGLNGKLMYEATFMAIREV